MLRSYLRLLLFAFGLLVGVQVPAFLDAYGQRVEAHRLESVESLSGFSETARRFFGGDLHKLVAHYRASDDAVMRSDAASLDHLVSRAALLEREWQAMQGPWHARAWHVFSAADQRLLAETMAGYRYQILLDPSAIAWGLSCALLLAALVESLLVMLGSLLLGKRRRALYR
jgi:hypothetical protein